MNFYYKFTRQSSKQHYYCVCVQGPLPETFGDFWRMIWEQRSQTIVMMTKLEERARVSQTTYKLTNFTESTHHVNVVCWIG